MEKRILRRKQLLGQIMKLQTLAAIFFAGGLLSGGFAMAGDKKADAKATRAVAQESWVKKAAQGGMAEVELGKLAQKKAQSDAVKQYAQHMVEDHNKANDELMKVAAVEGITPPSQPAPEHMATKKELTQASGAEFDKKYMEAQIKDHKEMIALFEQGAKSNSRPIKEYASKTLPSLKKHLKMAQDVHGVASKAARK
jgi:putative membrane protein